jgi:NADH-quinone oxidoreductase subunit L
MVLLALGSILAGYVGVPSVLGGSSRIEEFLAPSFEAPGPPAAERPIGGAPGSPATVDQSAGPGVGVEAFLMAIAIVAALAGIGAAAFFFLTSPEAASALARRFPGLHRLLLNQYYVDQVYNAAIVRPVDAVSRKGLWRGVDVSLVDRTVDLVALIVAGAGSTLRRVQTGSLRVYAAWLLLGIVVILGYYAGW